MRGHPRCRLGMRTRNRRHGRSVVQGLHVPLDALGRASICLPASVVRGAAADQPVDLTKEIREHVFLGERRKARLAQIVEGPRIHFETFREFPKEQKARSVKRQVEIRHRAVRTTAFRQVIIEKPSFFDMGAEDPTHEERVVADVLPQVALSLDLAVCLIGSAARLLQHLHQAVDALVSQRTDPIEVIAAGEGREHTGHVLDDVAIEDA